MRGTPSAFTENDVSVSRLDVLAFGAIIDIFRKTIDKPGHNGLPAVVVKACAIINCGELRAIESETTILDITEDKIIGKVGQIDNPAHALIRGSNKANPGQPKSITRGMANDILKICATCLLLE
ncbi:MAG: hypothetical protein ACYDAW_06330 [Acidithiobacillus ferrivorans]